MLENLHLCNKNGRLREYKKLYTNWRSNNRRKKWINKLKEEKVKRSLSHIRITLVSCISDSSPVSSKVLTEPARVGRLWIIWETPLNSLPNLLVLLLLLLLEVRSVEDWLECRLTVLVVRSDFLWASGLMRDCTEASPEFPGFALRSAVPLHISEGKLAFALGEFLCAKLKNSALLNASFNSSAYL